MGHPSYQYEQTSKYQPALAFYLVLNTLFYVQSLFCRQRLSEIQDGLHIWEPSGPCLIPEFYRYSFPVLRILYSGP